MKGSRVWVLRDLGLVGGDFPVSGGEVAALRRFMGGKVIRLDLVEVWALLQVCVGICCKKESGKSRRGT